MRILLLRHYTLSEGPSMRIFADQISTGLRGRGYRVQEFTAPVLLGRLLPRTHAAAKWLGYLDQFLIFPPWLWLRARLLPRGSLCVLADQALGPWLPWLGGRAHVVHCHDLLALEASFGLQPFHRLSRSGLFYQRWILQGFRKGRCFLSVSAATQAALERHLPHRPQISAVLHNPLASRFRVIPKDQAAASVRQACPRLNQQPFLFHIGLNWYKNRVGVLEIWDHLQKQGFPQHLVLVGSADRALQSWLEARPQLCTWLHVLVHADDDLVVALYNRAAALLFPSHGEGFGWPILEALACGCPVITTDRPPMTEVGGEAVTTIPPAPPPPEPLEDWAREAAQQVQQVLTRSTAEQERIRQLGFAQARRFQLEPWLDQLESHYQQALALQESRACAP
jgi:glycosyltransferase involved in cell wall biosynthesis